MESTLVRGRRPARTIAALFTVIVLATSVTAVGPTASALGSFSDDDGSVHEANIEAIAAVGITRGCNPPANDRFCPDDPVTRGQMAAFLHRALDGVLTPGPTPEYTDDNNSVFETDIEWLGATAVARGCNPPANDQFCPDDPVTRGQMAAFLPRARDLPTSRLTFTDTAGHVFAADISALAGAAITLGCNPPDNSRFCPDALLTRGEMATFLHRAGLAATPPSSTSTTVSHPTTSTISTAPTTSAPLPTTTTSTTSSSTTTSSTTTSTAPPPGSSPVLDPVGSQWAKSGLVTQLILTAIDVDGGPLEFDGIGLPGFVTVENLGSGSARLTIAPNPGDEGSYDFTLVVMDHTDLTDTEAVHLTVQADTAGNLGSWLEVNGLLLIDAESQPLLPNWALATPKGYLGSGVLEWTVADQHQGTPTVGIITYPIEITNGGTYRVSARSRREGTGGTDEHNDMFVKIDNGPWTKFFQRGGAHRVWEWQHRRETRDEAGNHIREDWLIDLQPGSHLIRISGRSVQFQLDRIALHLDHSSFPQDHFPESPRAALP